MPWKEAGPVLERARFIEDYLSGFYTITELAARYGVSRRALHKWLSRHDADGRSGPIDRGHHFIRHSEWTSDMSFIAEEWISSDSQDLSLIHVGKRSTCREGVHSAGSSGASSGYHQHCSR